MFPGAKKTEEREFCFHNYWRQTVFHQLYLLHPPKSLLFRKCIMRLLVWAHEPFGHQVEFKGFLVGTSYMIIIVYRDIFSLFLTCLWYCLSVLAYFSYLARLVMGMFGFFSGVLFVLYPRSTPGKFEWGEWHASQIPNPILGQNKSFSLKRL